MHDINQPTGVLPDAFTINSTFKIDDQLMMYKGDLGDDALNIIDVKSGKMLYVTNPETGLKTVANRVWLLHTIAKGALEMVSSDVSKHPRVADDLRELDLEELKALDPMAPARVGLLFLLASEGIVSNDPALGGHIKRIWSAKFTSYGLCPATSTVRTWLRRTDPERPQLADLVSMTGRVDRPKRLDPEVTRIVEDKAVWYWLDRGRKIEDAFSAAVAAVKETNIERKAKGLEVLKAPSRETIRREVRGIESRSMWVQKFGETAAKRHWDAARGSITAKRALEIVQIDDTVLDCIACVDAEHRLPANRPYLCIAICVATRCIVGWVLSFSPPTASTVAECLRRMGTDKFDLSPEWIERYPVLREIAGKPSVLYSDNGKNYIAISTVEVLRDLGITVRRAPIGAPKSKANVESFFPTLKKWLLEKLPGHTLDPKTLRELNLNPEVRAVLLIEELEALIQEFINTYHISLHSGIGTQPAAAWLRSIKAHGRLMLDVRKLNILTWLTEHNRRLTTGGIRFKGLTYRSTREVNELLEANLPGETMKSRLKGTAACNVQIKYNPENLRSILVRNRQTAAYVEVPCLQQRYADGLTLHQHEQLQEWAKNRNLEFNSEEERILARHNLNLFIEATIPGMTGRQRRAVARFTEGSISKAERHEAEIAHTEATSSGMGPVLEQDDAAAERTDAETPICMPASGKVAQGGSHDSDTREIQDVDPDFGSDDDLWQSPPDDDLNFEEDYA
ncbi:putative transposase [Sphingobium sp. B11D3B]|uniref:transposase family protein n=1 Tax=Sphingobium sp. B11D3B TaxID=2940575 RepID=UPI0022279C7F|nr:transposase family protein [Sphingobium sp. B11D3B]MCW2390060.1 putative transposase [Sphingobium sp. B11D3B]